MREIRFRAWHKQLKKMLYPPNHFDSMLNVRDSDGNHVTIDLPDAKKVTFPASMIWDGRMYLLGYLQPLEWMQFTGLKDKNGKEIYEGDIIQFKSYDVYKKWWSSVEEIPEIEESCKRQREAFKTERLVVKFEDGCFVLNWVLTLKDVARGQRYKTGSTHYCDTEEKQWDFEVIGNIYEITADNPEWKEHILAKAKFVSIRVPESKLEEVKKIIK